MFFGFTLGALAQIKQVNLPQINVIAANYKYLNLVDSKDTPEPIKVLHQEVADFEVKDLNYSEDYYESYRVLFEIPLGRILATYDTDSKLLRTSESFKNVKLPLLVSKSIAKKYPDWYQAEDVYIINYYVDNTIKKVYRIYLIKDERHLWVKTDEYGNIK